MVFEEYETAEWMAFKDHLEGLVRSYEIIYQKHFRSGIHKGIAFTQFTESKILLYIHLIMNHCEGLFHKATATLPEIVVRESCKPKGSSTTNSNIPKKSPSAAANRCDKERQRYNKGSNYPRKNRVFLLCPVPCTKISCVTQQADYHFKTSQFFTVFCASRRKQFFCARMKNFLLPRWHVFLLITNF